MYIYQKCSAINSRQNKVHRIIFCTVFLLMTPIDAILAQQVINANLYQDVFKTCKDQYYEIGITSYYEYITCKPTEEYLVASKTLACSFDLDRIETNNSLKIEGAGIGDYTILQRSSGAYYFRVKFISTAPYTISWKMRYHYPPNNCGRPAVDEYLYTWTSRKVFSVPKPPTPTVTALKGVVMYPESTTIICSDCPNTLAGTSEYPYSNGSSIVDWAFQCGPNGQLDFDHTVRSYSSPYFLSFDSRQSYYTPGARFAARCNDNGCQSEISDPVAVSVQYVTPNCPDNETAFIDNFYRDGSRDYHYYTVETVVCNKADNSNCTVGKVFNLLKSNKFNNAPVAGDFPAASIPSITSPLIPLQAHIPLAGSNLVYKIDATPVQNCQRINLPSVFGMGANLAALASIASTGVVGEVTYMFTRTATDNQFIGNSILQYIDETAHSITNYTRPGHILYPGKVTRIVVGECDRIRIVTIGSGKSRFGNNAVGEFMANRNINSGTALFQSIDQRVVLEFNRLYR